MRCAIPVGSDGPLVRSLLSEVKQSLPPLGAAKQRLTLHTWEGRTAKRIELAPG